MSEDKKKLRRSMLEIRKGITDTDRLLYSQQIFSKIEGLKVFQEAVSVLLYWSMNNEVFTHDFVGRWNDRKKIFLPVTTGSGLKLKQYKGVLQPFKTASFTIMEPAGSAYYPPELVDLAIIPGLAFDRDNNRLGYGKGYYDNLLANMRAFKIGVCFSFHLKDSIPHSEYDIRMDRVITN